MRVSLVSPVRLECVAPPWLGSPCPRPPFVPVLPVEPEGKS
jgi:hypothetical protein